MEALENTITVELNDVRIYATHGLYEEEALTGHEFKLDLSISYIVGSDTITSIQDTINYEEVFQLIKGEIQKDRHQLLEACVMKLANLLKQHYPKIKHLEIKMEKLNAPIAQFNGKVGVRFSKNYS